MKRMLALLLSLLLLLSTGLASTVLAETDYSNFSFDELMGIQEKLNLEIQSRPEAGKRTLESGTYLIGKDIAQGTYVLSLLTDGGFTTAISYGSQQLQELNEQKTWNLINSEEKARASYYNGDVLWVNGNPIYYERVGNVEEVVVPEYTIPDGTTIPKGVYTVGDMIPAGTYSVNYNGNSIACFTVVEKKKDVEDEWKTKLRMVFDPFNTTVTVPLEEGMMVTVDAGSVIMKKMTAFTFD